MKNAQTVVTEAQERLLLDALRHEVRLIGTEHFRGALVAPVITLDDATTRFAAWDSRHRTLTVSRVFLAKASWTAVREVLKHECAHQYVDEVLRIHDENAHGESFRKVCAERGIDARAAGAIDDDGAGAGAEHDAGVERVLRRVEKLLALAQSDNKNEAEAAADAAQRLMLEHNLAAQARPRRYIVRTLGTPTARMHAHEKLLGGLLSNHYFVDVILVRAWMHGAARMGTVIEVSGTPENVEMATWIHAFLLGAAERCWGEEHARRGLPPRERLPFFAGFMMGVAEKLKREQQAQQERGLVWVGDADLGRFVRLRHPHVRSGRFGGALRDGHAAGREAGNDVVIARPVEAGATDRGRALPPRR
jgi:hypothetical protein